MIRMYRRWRAAKTIREELHSLTEKELSDIGIPKSYIDVMARQEALHRYP